MIKIIVIELEKRLASSFHFPLIIVPMYTWAVYSRLKMLSGFI